MDSENDAELVVADEGEAELAARAAERLADVATLDNTRFVIKGENKTVVLLPGRAVGLLKDMLGLMAARTPFSIVSTRPELTTQEAAERLGVSRPFLVKLLDSGRIPHRVVGRHRRVAVTDVESYRRTMRRGLQDEVT